MSCISPKLLLQAKWMNQLAGRLLSSCVTSDSNYKTAIVNSANMAYLDVGRNKDTTKTVVFLHGNPTSSYLWRNIIPHVTDIARCIAPDLIGMGRSQKLKDSMYTFDDHYSYLSNLLESLNLPDKLNLVIHDWGSALGFHWANCNRDRVESITFMESLVAPLTYEDFPEEGREAFKAFRSPLGEELILENNAFVEQIIPLAIKRTLKPEEMEVYRKPFADKGEGRRPTLTFPRQLIIDGLGDNGPESVREKMLSYKSWLSESSYLPKLYIDANPGQLSPAIRKIVRNWPNLKMASVSGLHYLQEDSPDEIGVSIREFYLNHVFR
uniref:haloalkane dehalogenase-like isoform X1 n=2 Tax=Styela clava TaxID=7725 RepID=UPI00193A5A0A|nr:haloalkane dehalogenase-like isoform X1 [Styela clava]